MSHDHSKGQQDGDDRGPLLILSFREKQREYPTGARKRKLEPRRRPLSFMPQQFKERKLWEERPRESLKMLAEREEALEESDELQWLVAPKTELVQCDHPNHTATVSATSDRYLSGTRLSKGPGWVGGGSIIHGEASQSHTREAQSPPATPVGLLSPTIATCTIIRRSRANTPD